AQRFGEVEIQLLRNDEDTLRRLGIILEASGATPDTGRPTLFRALGLDAPARPAVPDASASTSDIVTATMRSLFETIRAHDPGTRLGKDPEDLHKMRTGVRRLRAILRAARSLFDVEQSEALRTELDWLGTALGAVRDLDVLLQSLRGEIAGFGSPE